MNRRPSNQWQDRADDESRNDEPRDDPSDHYDDSQGYSDDGDEDEEYEEFLEREFGSSGRRSRPTRLQFWTTVVLLFSFALPFLVYLYLAIAQ